MLRARRCLPPRTGYEAWVTNSSDDSDGSKATDSTVLEPKSGEANISTAQTDLAEPSGAVEPSPAADEPDLLVRVTGLRPEWSVLAVVALLAVLVALLVLSPVLPAVIFGGLLAHIFRPLRLRLTRLTKRQTAASLITTMVAASVFVPIALLGVGIYQSADSFAAFISDSTELRNALRTIVPSNVLRISFDALPGILGAHIRESASAAGAALGAASDLGLQIFFVFVSLHTFLVFENRIFLWAAQHSPLPPAQLRRLVDAVCDTGRSVVVGVGVTSVGQGIVATLVYTLLGVHYAAILGAITMFAALIPSFGTALVWVPVTIGLFLTGHTWQGTVLAIAGVVLISSVDNFLTPYLAGRTSKHLPTSVILLSMLGGLLTLGGWGLILGPLAVRIAVEALAMLKQEPPAEPPAAVAE